MNNRIDYLIKLVARIIMPIIMLIGGIILLSLHLPGWSIILGLPVSIFGVIFMIYTYDEVITKSVVNKEKDLKMCPICKKVYPVGKNGRTEDFICNDCREKIIGNISNKKGNYI